MSDPVVLQSAVRVPTPPPGADSPTAASRKRSPPSRSPSPNRRRSPPGDSQSRENVDVPRMDDDRAIERERQLAERVREHEKQEAARKPMTEEEKQASAKAEYEKLLNMRSGGTYIPPSTTSCAAGPDHRQDQQGVPAHGLGGAEKVDQRSDQQSQCLQYQIYRPRTLW
ncbi:hypothetical protein N7509_003575 [Penicillium cosmopolitanum]|uniref:Uncharacterized protein n=1 Tax=Penicillium cosmopolitanum TaxID=1131564 RepID=A0A9W9W583_9EURO|nr:uncharacterized protein N7509_003575 [Penicillium cosmopolitanum]KAJ5403704.1 hypothetical protein N7509_003575 [Penicillium cosmopolitanum]